MKTKQSLTIMASTLGLALTFILLAGLRSVSAKQATTTFYVTPVGSGSACTQAAPCQLKYALDNAAHNDSIYISGGVYTSSESSVLKITKNISIHGGWNGLTGALVVDPSTYPTVLDGENTRRVVYISPSTAPILYGLTLQRGNAVGQGGDLSIPGADVGGAVYANNASPTISNCLIMSSTAGFGAGLALYNAAPTIVNNEIRDNTANQNISTVMRGVGGGILLYQSGGVINNNKIINNNANGTQVYDGGGGIYLDGCTSLVSDNIIQNNYGHRGGGLFIYMSAINVNANTVVGNNAGLGGGIFLMSSPSHLDANTIVGNGGSVAGGGLAIFESINFTLTNNIVAQNFGGYPAGLVVSALFDGLSSQGVFIHNTIVDNHAPPYPWEILVGNSPLRTANVNFTNNIIGLPGGVYVYTGSMVTANTTYWDKMPIGVELSGFGTIISSTNIYGDADFVNQYRLSSRSMAIDQGANAGLTTDIDGETRPNGAIPDIGADEFYCYPFSSVSIVGPTDSLYNTGNTFIAAALPLTASLPVTYSWQATGQNSITRLVYSISDTVIYTWPVTGTQTITLTAENCGGSVVDTHTITLNHSHIFLPLVLRQ